jgi:hypothetical protein
MCIVTHFMLEIIKKIFYLPSVCSYQKVCFLHFTAMVLQLSMDIPPNEIKIVYMRLLRILAKAPVQLLFYIVLYCNKLCKAYGIPYNKHHLHCIIPFLKFL